jgi:hypothetical protein
MREGQELSVAGLTSSTCQREAEKWGMKKVLPYGRRPVYNRRLERRATEQWQKQ